MKTLQITIINKLGLHARAASKLVTLAANYDCDIKILYKSKKANGKSIMGVMMLAAGKGSIISIITDGIDENQALEELEKLINNRFDEAE